MAATRRSPSRPRGEARTDAREFEEWDAWYASQDYRKMPWHSPGPSPWLVRAVRTRRIPPGSSVLDVGCGSGSNSLWLQKRGFRATGIDVSRTVIAVAQRRARAAGLTPNFRVANAAALPFADRSFGAALDTGCFHSLPIRLRRRYAREIARVLRAGSPLLLTWIPREVRSAVGPPHRPSLTEVAAVFEPSFLFAAVERHEAGSRGGWLVCGERCARSTALLIRRPGRAPPSW